MSEHVDVIVLGAGLSGIGAACRLRTEQVLTVVQLVAGPVLGHHAGQPQAVGRQTVSAPADAAQAFDDQGIAHG